jgi:nucleoside-diphosphate-sugar epimerase
LGATEADLRALVTGGGGFLGKAIVKQLLEQGWRVRSLSRGAYSELEVLGVEALRGDLAERGVVKAAVAGCDVVFHVAAKAGIWGSWRDYFRTNVIGTANVVGACRSHGVPKLVYTSSPSVVHSGGDIEGGDESLPYPRRFEAAYPETKASGEQMALGANNDRLSTVYLRPHLIWGPEDNHLVPRLIARHRSGRLRLVGDGSNVVDTVYVEDAARAHLLAAERLEPGAACAGKAYFITQGEPLPLIEWINGIVGAAGLPPVTRSVSPRLAVILGAIFEGVFKTLRISSDPPLTRFVARHLATAHWYDISAAKEDLGYKPEIPIAAGFQRLEQWISSGGLDGKSS